MIARIENTIEFNEINYRWYVLTLVALTFAFTNAIRLCLPVLFDEISRTLNLSLVQIGLIWGFDPLAGIFASIFGGLVIDKFGVKRTVTFVIFFMGIFGALRGLSSGFIALSVATFLFGSLTATTPTILPKAVAIWFKGRHLGLANGIVSSINSIGGMAATMMSATLLSPLLGGWRNVLFIYGIPPIAMSLFWFFTYRDSSVRGSEKVAEDSVPFRKALSHVLCIKAVWGMGIVQFGSYGAYIAVLGYLPIYLRGLGWNHAIADSATTILILGISLSSIPISLLSDKMESRRKILLPVLLILCMALCLVPLAKGPGIWVLIAVSGLMVGGMIPLSFAITMEIKGIGGTYTGTALGITASMSMLGCFISPPLGNSFAHFHPGLPFVIWGALLGIVLMGFLLQKESK